MAFKLETNVPEYYPETSRDFQLLCRILDIYLSALIERAAQMSGNWGVEGLSDKLLPLMAHKLGYLEGSYIPPRVLRNICRVYPTALKHKGTLEAVRELAHAVLSADQPVNSLEVSAAIDSSGLPQVFVVADTASTGLDLYLTSIISQVLPAGVELRTRLGLSLLQSVATTLQPVSSVYRIRHNLAATSQVGNKPETVPEPAEGKTDWNTALSELGEADDSLKIAYSRVGVGTVVGSTINDMSNLVVRDPQLRDG